MLGILNHVMRTATGTSAGLETGHEREWHIRHEDLKRRREEEAELYRQLRRRINQ